MSRALAPARAPSRALLPPRVAILLIVLLAFAARAWHLDFQSLWSDEGISLQRATLPLATLFERMPVEHAPGYFVLLHGWVAITGTSDFALRYFSLLPSVLSVALIFRLGNDLAQPLAQRRTLALLAAALLATNAFQMWYAQEARMYALLFATGIGATWALWRLLHDQSPRRTWFALGYALCTATLVYLHYYGALIPIAHMLYVLVWGIATRRWRALGAWAIASAGALLLFAPWLPRALGIFGFEGWREGGSVSAIPRQFLNAYLLGYSTPPALQPWLLYLLLGLALLGAIWWVWRRVQAALLLLLLMSVPMAAVVWLATRNPDYHERYTIIVAAPLLLFVAGGVIGLHPRAWQRAQASQPDARPVAAGWWLALALLAALLLLANGSALTRHYTDATLHKPDFRAAAQRIATEGRAGDVILVDGPDPELVFNHYYTQFYEGDLPVHDLRSLETAPWEEVSARLLAATDGATRAWEVLYFHEPAAVQVWLATQAWATAPTMHNHIRVTLYGLQGDSGEPVTHNLAYGDALLLESTLVSPAQVRAGDLVHVRSDWLTRSQPADYKFSLRLLDGSGAVVWNDDYVPQNWFAPTSVWVVGNPARDQRAILIPDTLPAGVYTLALRLYDATSGSALVTAAGEDLPLGTVEVLP